MQGEILYLRLFRNLSHAGLLTGVMAILLLLTACGEREVIREEYFPALTLKDIDGVSISTQEFRGKVLVLNVWASWCPPCRREMPSLEELSRKVDGNHIVVAGLSADKDVNLVQEFLGQSRITFRNFIDTDGSIVRTLDTLVYPVTLLISPDGKIVYRVQGERDWSSPAILAVLEEIYQGKRSGFDSRLSGTVTGQP